MPRGRDFAHHAGADVSTVTNADRGRSVAVERLADATSRLRIDRGAGYEFAAQMAAQ